jgi:hypothetical protein
MVTIRIGALLAIVLGLATQALRADSFTYVLNAKLVPTAVPVPGGTITGTFTIEFNGIDQPQHLDSSLYYNPPSSGPAIPLSAEFFAPDLPGPCNFTAGDACGLTFAATAPGLGAANFQFRTDDVLNGPLLVISGGEAESSYAINFAGVTGFQEIQGSAVVTSEPGTLTLLGIGMLGLAVASFLRKS